MREHYAITLMKTEGETVTLFINHLHNARPIFLWTKAYHVIDE